MNRSQVNALLEVISIDPIRPVLTYAMLDEYEGRLVLVATDAHKLVALTLAGVSDEQRAQYAGKLISRDNLTKWYKLAGAKDVLTTDALLSMAETIDGMALPKWQHLLAGAICQASPTISFNALYALMLERLAGTHLRYQLCGTAGPMQAEHNGNLYELMPLRY